MYQVIILIAIFYILPAFLYWNYIRIAYSKDGIWEDLKTEDFDIFIMFMPLFNIIAIAEWFNWPRISNKKNRNNFFKIKK